uniref:Acetylcholinesterase n=1 Tax=Parastrongyloides trichosuri TaxID=131310 RepID=A0A0N5A295_PARTI
MIAIFIYFLLLLSVSDTKKQRHTSKDVSAQKPRGDTFQAHPKKSVLTRTVNTTHGTIKGRPNKQFPSILEFLGVPYAQAPVGPLRFMPPKALNESSYGNNFNATKLANTCPHHRIRTNITGFDEWDNDTLKMDEDCLQLNIWIPKRNKENNILVFIHGRSYSKGSASTEFFNGAAFAYHTNITFIAVGYRLGALGFGYWKPKNSDEAVIPGNMGLLDQQMALEWIKNNSASFGFSNPNITLMGHGSGASSATAHLFSKNSKRLFHRIIAASGTIQNRWAVEKNKHVRENFKTLIGKLKCNVSKETSKTENNETKILECMQNMPVLNITETFIRNPNQSMIVGPFLPVENDTVFFNTSIRYKLGTKSMYKNVSVLIGLESYDAAYFLPQFLKDDKYGCGLDYEKPMEDPVNQCHMNETKLKNAIKLVAKDFKIKDELFRDGLREIYDFSFNSMENRYRDRAIKLFTDIVMQCDIIEFARKITKFTLRKNYMFVFNKRSTYNPWPKWMGATHGYELLYFFGYPFLHPEKYKPTKLSEEKEFSRKAMKIIARFARTEVLQKDWSEYTNESVYAAVLSAKTQLASLDSERNMKTWTCTHFKELLGNYTKVNQTEDEASIGKVGIELLTVVSEITSKILSSL